MTNNEMHQINTIKVRMSGMPKVAMVETALCMNMELTPSEIREAFELKNPRAAISSLRKIGWEIPYLYPYSDRSHYVIEA